jgi:hypothetical protein
MAKRKRINNDLQNTTQETKDRATRTPIQNWGELWYYFIPVLNLTVSYNVTLLIVWSVSTYDFLPMMKIYDYFLFFGKYLY